jgi:transposase
MRGASFLVAVIFVAEIGDMRRFDTPRQLMSFLGLVPAESSRRLPGFGVSLSLFYATTLRLFCSWSWK